MITQGNQSAEFTYGPARQRYYQVNRSNGSLTKTTITVNALFQEDIQGGTIRYQHFIRAAGQTIAIHTRTNQTDANDNYQHNTRYLHRDHIGSLVAISDATGTVIAKMRYDAFGARIATTGQSPATNPAPGIERGYTGHQMLDAVGLIHMNGRVYDPVIGRFLSADPLIQAPYNSQSYNRYSYVWNNPLSATDPSGFQMQFSYCRFCEPIPIMGGTLGMSIMASGDTYFCAYGGRAACSTNSKRMRQGQSFIPRGGSIVQAEAVRRGLTKEQQDSLSEESQRLYTDAVFEAKWDAAIESGTVVAALDPRVLYNQTSWQFTITAIPVAGATLGFGRNPDGSYYITGAVGFGGNGVRSCLLPSFDVFFNLI